MKKKTGPKPKPKKELKVQCVTYVKKKNHDDVKARFNKIIADEEL